MIIDFIPDIKEIVHRKNNKSKVHFLQKEKLYSNKLR